MRQHRNLFVFILIMILGMALLTGCGTLGAGSAGDEGSGDGGTGDGGSGAGSSNEDDTSGDEEDDAFDEIDISTMGCPEEPTMFGIFLDFQLNVEEDDGYIHERTDPMSSYAIMIHGSEVDFLSEYHSISGGIDVTIDGRSGDCTITGIAQISLEGGGTCKNGIATLDINGSYDFYQRSIYCPGEPSVDAYDSLFPGPSITAEFRLSNSGDTVENSWQGGGGMQYINAWILKPLDIPYDEEAMGPHEPEFGE